MDKCGACGNTDGIVEVTEFQFWQGTRILQNCSRHGFKNSELPEPFLIKVRPLARKYLRPRKGRIKRMFLGSKPFPPLKKRFIDNFS